MFNQLTRLIKEEEGQALTEYGLLVGLIAVAVIGLLATIGDELVDVFQTIITQLQTI